MREKGESLKQKPPRQAITREVIDIPTAPKLDQEPRSRKELGKLFNVSHEAIRIWEENGKLKQLGWERTPHISSPVKYSRTTS